MGKETTNSKKSGRQRRGQTGVQPLASEEAIKSSEQKSNTTSPNNNNNTTTKKRSNASGSAGSQGTAGNTANILNREDAGWKEVVRKSKKVIVPANAISRVIGRGGCNINAIREMSGAHIEVEKLQGKASSGQQTERTILIKGSAEATRQANNWIQQIISSPDKDMADILGKSFTVQTPASKTVASFSTIQSTVIVNSNAKMASTVATTNVTSGVMTPLTLKKVIAASTGNVSVSKPAAFPSSKTAAQVKSGSAVASAVNSAGSAAAAAQSSGSTFAAVASGSGTDSFGMIQTGGTHPGTLAKANNNKKAKTPEIGPTPPQPLMSENSMDFIGTFEPVKQQEVASATSPASAVAAAVSVSAKANLDNKDYSPFKSYTSGWGNANEKAVPALAASENDKNFATVAAAGIDLGSTGDLAAKAPGYRISPSGGPLLATQTGVGGWGTGPTGLPSTSGSMLVRPVATSSSNSTVTTNATFNTERSNSAPGSPIIHSPIGPPPGVQMPPTAPIIPSSGATNSNKMANTTSPGSEPDQYRTGSSLSSGIGLSPGSGTGLGNHIRSMTPDSDSMRTSGTTMSSTGGGGGSGVGARSGSMTGAMDKSDIFGVRPASSGSANNSGFVVNPENLLNAAAQMASAFAASDMDYLGGRTGQFNDFASTPSASRFTNPQSTTASAFMPPTSKLNPNAPDFMRPSSTTQQDYRMRTQQQQQQQQQNLLAPKFHLSTTVLIGSIIPTIYPTY